MKKWILLAVAQLGCFAARAQSPYYFGGDISLTASSSGTSVVVYPEIGRRINQYFRVGIAAGSTGTTSAAPRISRWASSRT